MSFLEHKSLAESSSLYFSIHGLSNSFLKETDLSSNYIGSQLGLAWPDNK